MLANYLILVPHQQLHTLYFDVVMEANGVKLRTSEMASIEEQADKSSNPERTEDVPKELAEETKTVGEDHTVGFKGWVDVFGVRCPRAAFLPLIRSMLSQMVLGVYDERYLLYVIQDTSIDCSK